MAQTTSEIWNTLWAMDNTEREYGFDINGVWYGPEAEVSHSVSSGLYEEFGIGNAVIAQLTMDLYADDIPKSATIKRYIRLRNGDQVSEWLPKGEFFINRRSVDDGYWTIEAFDAMRKAEAVWDPDQNLVFPMSMPNAVAEFARIMGVSIDERTALNSAYTIDYPANDYTIRQELQYIAAAHGGNFIITDAGKLLLVPLISIPAETNYLVDERGNPITFGGVRILIGSQENTSAAPAYASGNQFFVGLDVTGFENNGKRKPISRVTLLADDESAYTAGDDTGLELSSDCPHATQTIVENILDVVQGYQYQAYSAEAANIDPSAELGDGVTVCGIYSVLARFADDGSGYVGISAPGEDELEDEYPSSGPMTQTFTRKLASISTQITKTAEEIGLKVEATDSRVASLSLKIDSFETRIQNAENQVSSISQKVDSITLSVVNGSESSTISLMAGSTVISSKQIKMTGLVTFTDLSTEGATTIYGGNVETDTLRVNNLYGSYVYLNTQDDAVAGMISISGADTASFAVDVNSYGAMRLTANNGAVYIASYVNKVYSSYIQIGNYEVSVGPSGAALRPGADSAVDLGLSRYYWNNIYCKTSSIDLSDRNCKKNVNYDMSRYGDLFDRIRPCSYLFEDGSRTHWGMISQDFEQAIHECGFTNMDVAAFCRDEMPDGTYRYALRYAEFIPLLIWEVQRLKAKIETLEGADL